MTDLADRDDADALPREVASKYRLVERIGEGGMGVVYAAEHLELHTRVAIKVLQPKLAPSPSARARVVREARLAASIQSEHSTRIHDVGLDPVEGPYIVMEHLVGETVDARLVRSGILPLEEAATIVMHLLDALAEAHARGLVHRDLKPANLFMVERPGEPVWVKVLDFGISKAVAAELPDTLSITEPHTIVGSPHYMSPEQLRDSNAVDARSDLWACGVILHELLTGKMPFEAAALPDLCAQIVSRAPAPLVAPGVPSAVVRLVERCLRKEPAERPTTCFDLATVLAPHASPSARASLSRIGAWCKRDGSETAIGRPRGVALGGLAIVAAAGVIAFAAASFERSRGAAGEVRSTGASFVTPTPSAPNPPTRALEPVVATPNATTAPTSEAPVAPSVADASAPPAAPSAPPTPKTSTAPKPTGPRKPDLDTIDLIH